MKKFASFKFDRLLQSVPYGVWVFPFVAILISVLSVYFCAKAASGLAEIISHRTNHKSSDAIALSQDEITPDQALTFARKLNKNVPAMSVAVKGSQIVISSREVERFAEFMAALAFVQSSQSDLRWSATELCLKTCGTEDAMRAVVTASKTKLNTKE